MTEGATFTQMTGISLWHLRGPDAVATATAAGIRLDPDWFRHVAITGGGLAAQLGAREVFVLDTRSAEASWSRALQDAADHGTWIFPRQDHIFALEGPGWRELLLAVCAYEFEQNRGGDFVMTYMAGAGCWFALPHINGDPVIVGCDPSYSRYLKSTIADVLANRSLDVSTAKSFETKGEAHDA
jgi:hypothetical protein